MHLLISSCPPLYVGQFCQHLNPCHTGPGPRCQNGGTCKVGLSAKNGPTFSCSCPVGYSASLCEIAVPNSCDSNPCQNGGTCNLVTLNNYTCSCTTGYRGKLLNYDQYNLCVSRIVICLIFFYHNVKLLSFSLFFLYWCKLMQKDRCVLDWRKKKNL